MDSLAASAALRLGFRRGSFKLLVDAVSADTSRVLTAAVVAGCRDDRRRGFSGISLSPFVGSLIFNKLDIMKDILGDVKMER